jgi:histo-blood group ABO system transferase
MKKVTLNLIATNKYTLFLDDIIQSARDMFVNDCKLSFIIYTDSQDITDSPDIERVQIPSESWPMPTLKRFHYFLSGREKIEKSDFSFYVDVDSIFRKQLPLSDMIIGDKGTIGTLHPGFTLISLNPQGTPERNPKSSAFIERGANENYYCGGFFGADSKSFIEMAEKISTNIDLDLENDIIAIWHDESHLNKYFMNNPPDSILGVGFSCSSEYESIASPTIVFLDKGGEDKKRELRNG